GRDVWEVQTQRTLQYVEVVVELGADMADAQHGNGEEGAAQAQDGIGDRGRQHRTGKSADDQAKRQQQRHRQGGEPFLDQAGGGGAKADEGRMAEAGIAREAAQDGPGDGEPCGVDHELPDAHIERRQHQRQGRQHEGSGQDDRHEKRGPLVHREGAKALPSRPCGRTSSSRTSSRTIVTLGKDGPIYCAVSVLTTPSSRPPIRAPAGLPTPPSTTTTKAFSVQVASSAGEKGRMMPMTIPAAPAKAADTAKVSA